MDYAQFINKSEKFENPNLLNNDTFHVVYCFDDNYSLGAGVSLVSLLENNKKTHISAHLFVIELSEENRSKFVNIIKLYSNLSLTIYHINSQFDINPNNKIIFPLAASLRIIAPEILKNITPQFLYIDCDTLVINDISKLKNITNNRIISVIEDCNAQQEIHHLNFSSSRYFNSGILLVNTQKWCENSTTNKILELLINENLEYPDQDALNIVLSTQCDYLPKSYNYQVEITNIELLNTEAINNIYIIHYIGPDKPWYHLFITDLYKKYLQRSPWKNENLKLAAQTQRIRIYSKKIRQYDKFKSFKYYALYLYYKIVGLH